MKNVTKIIKVELCLGSFLLVWFVASICLLIIGAIIGGSLGSWGVFFSILGSGFICIPVVLLTIFDSKSSKRSRKEIYLSACEGKFVDSPDKKSLVCEAKKIPFWDVLREKMEKDNMDLLSKENEILIGTSMVNIYEFTSKLKKKKLTKEEKNLLIRYGDEHLKKLFFDLYAGKDLTSENIEAVRETNPLWIFSFKDFTEKQLRQIINDWTPYELQGLEVDEKEGKSKMISVEEAKYLSIKNKSSKNIMDLVTLFDPDGELMKTLQKKLEGKLVLRPS